MQLRRKTGWLHLSACSSFWKQQASGTSCSGLYFWTLQPLWSLELLTPQHFSSFVMKVPRKGNTSVLRVPVVLPSGYLANFRAHRWQGLVGCCDGRNLRRAMMAQWNSISCEQNSRLFMMAFASIPESWWEEMWWVAQRRWGCEHLALSRTVLSTPELLFFLRLTKMALRKQGEEEQEETSDGLVIEETNENIDEVWKGSKWHLKTCHQICDR